MINEPIPVCWKIEPHISYQWHREEEQTNQDKQYTCRKPKTSTVTSSIVHNAAVRDQK